MKNRLQLKISLFATFASQLRALSTCKRTQVGCLIVPRDFASILAIGYNGVPSGLDNGLCNSQTGACGCIHAEANAIAKLRSERADLMLITSLSPCALCAGLIINTKQISKVIFIEEYRDLHPLTLLKKAGISVSNFS